MAESQQEKNLKSIDDFRMFDDTFMSAVFDGKTEEAAKLQRYLIPMVDALFCEVNPIPVKNAMNMMGLKVGPLRSPLIDLSPEHREYMKGVLEDYKLI